MPAKKTRARQKTVQALKKDTKEEAQRGRKKAIWSGFITFGLVSVPVSMYSSAAERPISFNMLCNTCFSPLRYRRWCEKCGREVPWQDVQKGYRISKNEYIIVTKHDLESMKIPAKDLRILEFVSGHALEPVYFERSYYILPERGGEHAFYLLLNAMEELKRSAIGKIVIRNKEDLVLLRPYKNAFLLTVLHYPQEILEVESISGTKEAEAIRFTSEEEKLAKDLVQAMTAEMNLRKYRNEYREALEEMIKAKAEGKVTAKPLPKAKEVKSLIEALKRSVNTAKK